jgi:nitrite reductase (NO-forming)
MRTLLLTASVLSLLTACERTGDDPQPGSVSSAERISDTTSTPDRTPIPAVLTAPPAVPPALYRNKPARVVVNLEVTEIETEIAPGVKYVMWTFGGSVPGKFIRVRQGDVVELHLQNHPSSKMPHNIDLHAVNGQGGGAEGTFTAPGKETQITFRALNPGLYVYHCATAPVPMHVANGMYGLILVEPPQDSPAKLGWADREFYLMQGELYTTGKYHEQGRQAFDMEKGIDEKPTYVLFNGAEGSLLGPRALRAKVGETIRIYVGNGGPNLVSSFHIIGEVFDRVYTEGGSQVAENIQTTLIPAGGAAIVEFKVEVPGTYAIVDHSLFRAFNKGAVGQLIVEGPSRTDVYSGQQSERAYTGTAVPMMATATNTSPPADLGKATYTKVCAACHQPEGQGVAGAFPPLAGSDYLAKTSKEKLINHIVHGVQGPMTVNGATYNGAMPPMAFLSDDEIAGALSFARSAWGNGLDAVSPSDVAKVRTQPPSAP